MITSAAIAVPKKNNSQKNEPKPKQTHRLFGEQNDEFVLVQIYFYYSFQLRQNLISTAVWDEIVMQIVHKDRSDSFKRKFLEFLVNFGEEEEAKRWAEEKNVPIASITPPKIKKLNFKQKFWLGRKRQADKNKPHIPILREHESVWVNSKSIFKRLLIDLPNHKVIAH